VPILNDEAAIAALLPTLKTVVVLGIKGEDQSDEPAYEIPAMLAKSGIEVIGVNPKLAPKSAYARLADVPKRADCLDVFRRIDAIPAHTDEILALPPELRPAGVWFQSGIRHDESARRLSEAGMWVVQDRCLGVYARRYLRR
jgi:hypothetical protein